MTRVTQYLEPISSEERDHETLEIIRNVLLSSELEPRLSSRQRLDLIGLAAQAPDGIDGLLRALDVLSRFQAGMDRLRAKVDKDA